MPVYEYACKTCGQHLEVAQSFKDEPLTTCPACSGPLRKVFGSIGISFKGTGFYRTDSRMAAKRQTASAGDGAGGDKEAAKAEGKSEGKSEGKDAGSAKDSAAPKAGAGSTAAAKSSPASKPDAKTA